MAELALVPFSAAAPLKVTDGAGELIIPANHTTNRTFKFWRNDCADSQISRDYGHGEADAVWRHERTTSVVNLVVPVEHQAAKVDRSARQQRTPHIRKVIHPAAAQGAPVVVAVHDDERIARASRSKDRDPESV